MTPPARPPAFSIVMPVYNEPAWVPVAVADAVAAVQASPFAQDAELVIVDDGSAPETQAALAALATPFPLRVIRQDNAGRFAARRRGIDAARGELVLLLDARVSVRPDALRFVADRIDGELPVWNAHVDVELARNPFARFWNIVAEVAFAEYFAQPRTTSYGLEDFDRFPKGTTGFIAPRTLLLEAYDAFTSHFEDTRDANDDTVLIRWIAERRRINISPGFSCLYRSRDALRPFLRHVFHRGGVFVDGYGRRGTRFTWVVAAFFPASAATALLALRHRRPAALAVAALPAVGAALGVYWRRPAKDVATLAGVGPLFLVAYAAGMWRGGWLAVRSRLRR